MGSSISPGYVLEVSPRTEEQLQQLAHLGDEELLARACASLHALNRRAKHLREETHSRLGEPDQKRARIEHIYALKTRLLDALVRAGRARVEHFDERSTAARWSCASCHRTWEGIQASCPCGRAGTKGEALSFFHVRWFLVSIGEYRWHVPESSATAAMKQRSRKCEAHPSYQPPREIPRVGLTLAAQCKCIELAIARLDQGPPTSGSGARA
jgi:hypothetical protein